MSDKWGILRCRKEYANVRLSCERQPTRQDDGTRAARRIVRRDIADGGLSKNRDCDASPV